MARRDACPVAYVPVGTIEWHGEHNPLGAKGCAEVGSVGLPPAIINAVLDALSELKVGSIEMPATAQAIWSAIQRARPT